MRTITATIWVLLLFLITQPAIARADVIDDLIDRLGFAEVIEIMREEGREDSLELAAEMIPGGASADWPKTIEEIYDPARMLATVKSSFRSNFGDADATPLLEFYIAGPGGDFVAAENSARRALMDTSIDDAARAAYRKVASNPDDRFRMIERFIKDNDLIDANVEGALNASFSFYTGLADGGAIELSESEMLTEIWGQEEETRKEVREWLFAFLLMAYGPMSDQDLEDYAAMSQAPEGKALNRAMFAAFDQMYRNISYATGLAIANEMKGQDL